jgi:hypothetical protein
VGLATDIISCRNDAFITPLQTPDTRISPRDVAGRYAVKNCGEA